MNRVAPGIRSRWVLGLGAVSVPLFTWAPYVCPVTARRHVTRAVRHHSRRWDDCRAPEQLRRPHSFGQVGPVRDITMDVREKSKSNTSRNVGGSRTSRQEGTRVCLGAQAYAEW